MIFSRYKKAWTYCNNSLDCSLLKFGDMEKKYAVVD